jgi:transketolase
MSRLGTKELELKANGIRQDIIQMLITAGSGHTAGPLGMADVLTALYFEVLKHDPAKPEWDERDRLVLSNGHIVPVLYATMAEAGYLQKSELKTLRSFGSRLQGHPERLRLPGLETTSGPLGSGLSQAVGMAIGLRMDQRKGQRVYCLTGDGELNEGNIWEAIMLAGKQRLSNLTVIIDRNNIQIDGPTEDVMPLEPLAMKWQAFNWHVIEIDGHNMEEIIAACDQSKAVYERPTCIIAHTIPGKGVDFMEHDFRWHGYDLASDRVKQLRDYHAALEKLRTLNGQIRSEHE